MLDSGEVPDIYSETLRRSKYPSSRHRRVAEFGLNLIEPCHGVPYVGGVCEGKLAVLRAGVPRCAQVFLFLIRNPCHNVCERWISKYDLSRNLRKPSPALISCLRFASRAKRLLVTENRSRDHHRPAKYFPAQTIIAFVANEDKTRPNRSRGSWRAHLQAWPARIQARATRSASCRLEGPRDWFVVGGRRGRRPLHGRLRRLQRGDWLRLDKRW